MKILFVINQDKIGGAEKIVFDLNNEINALEVQSDIFFLKFSGSDFFNFKSHKNKIYYGNKISLYNPLIIFKLLKSCKDYDIIHSHLFPSLYYVWILKLLRPDKIYIYTEHSSTNRRRKNLLIKYIERTVYSAFDCIVCINNIVLENLKNHLGFHKYLNIVPNGICIEEIKNTPRIDRKSIDESLNENDIIITQVSSFILPKDHSTLIKGIKSLPNNYKLVLVGDGYLRKDIEELTKTLGLTKRVFFLGIRTDAISIMKASNILVLSSEHEGLSIFCLESFACEVPIVGTRVEGIKELLNKSALFEYKSDIQFAELIFSIINDKILYTKIINYGLKKIKNYSINNTAIRHIELYQKLKLIKCAE